MLLIPNKSGKEQVVYKFHSILNFARFWLIMLSSYGRKAITAQTISLLLAALALPLGLHMLGIRKADYVSLNMFYSANQMLNQRTPGLLILGVCVLLLLLEGALLYLAETMGREG